MAGPPSSRTRSAVPTVQESRMLTVVSRDVVVPLRAHRAPRAPHRAPRAPPVVPLYRQWEQFSAGLQRAPPVPLYRQWEQFSAGLQPRRRTASIDAPHVVAHASAHRNRTRSASLAAPHATAHATARRALSAGRRYVSTPINDVVLTHVEREGTFAVYDNWNPRFRIHNFTMDNANGELDAITEGCRHLANKLPRGGRKLFRMVVSADVDGVRRYASTSFSPHRPTALEMFEMLYRLMMSGVLTGFVVTNVSITMSVQDVPALRYGGCATELTEFARQHAKALWWPLTDRHDCGWLSLFHNYVYTVEPERRNWLKLATHRPARIAEAARDWCDSVGIDTSGPMWLHELGSIADALAHSTRHTIEIQAIGMDMSLLRVATAECGDDAGGIGVVLHLFYDEGRRHWGSVRNMNAMLGRDYAWCENCRVQLRRTGRSNGGLNNCRTLDDHRCVAFKCKSCKTTLADAMERVAHELEIVDAHCPCCNLKLRYRACVQAHEVKENGHCPTHQVVHCYSEECRGRSHNRGEPHSCGERRCDNCKAMVSKIDDELHTCPIFAAEPEWSRRGNAHRTKLLHARGAKCGDPTTAEEEAEVERHVVDWFEASTANCWCADMESLLDKTVDEDGREVTVHHVAMVVLRRMRSWRELEAGVPNTNAHVVITDTPQRIDCNGDVLQEGCCCLDNFVRYLRTEHPANSTIAFHNGKGYDVWLLHAHLVAFYPDELSLAKNAWIFDGEKLNKFVFGGHTFRDTSLHFAEPLAKLPKTFGFAVGKDDGKEFFPYAKWYDDENTRQGWFDVPLIVDPEDEDHGWEWSSTAEERSGPVARNRGTVFAVYDRIPDREDFEPDGMSAARRADFESWHAARVAEAQPYPIFERCLEYCKIDVDILTRATEEYVRSSLTTTGDGRPHTGVNPMACTTAASVAKLVYETKVYPGVRTALASSYKSMVPYKLPRYVDSFVRESFCGGRTNVYSTYRRYTPEQMASGYYVAAIDVCSLYPSVQLYDKLLTGRPDCYVDDRATTNGRLPDAAKLRGRRVSQATLRAIVFRNGSVSPGVWRVSLRCVDRERSLSPVLVKRDHKLMEVLEDLPDVHMTHVDLQNALANGFELEHVHAGVAFEECDALFADYVRMFMGMKAESEDPPEDVDALIATYASIGIALDRERVMEPANPGKRAIAKLLLNSLWGKYGEDLDRSTVAYLKREAYLAKVERAVERPDELTIENVRVLTDETVYVKYTDHASIKRSLKRINVAIAASVTARARQRLLDEIARFDTDWVCPKTGRHYRGDPRRRIYTDTDSLYFEHRPGDAPFCTDADGVEWWWYNTPSGSLPGEWTDEMDKVRKDRKLPATALCSAIVVMGPKTYGIEMTLVPGEPATVTFCKAKGITQTTSVNAIVNFEAMQRSVIAFVEREREFARTGVVPPRVETALCTKKTQWVRQGAKQRFVTRQALKLVDVTVLSKRRLDRRNLDDEAAFYDTVPVGHAHALEPIADHEERLAREGRAIKLAEAEENALWDADEEEFGACTDEEEEEDETF